jgi:hypothetical protein
MMQETIYDIDIIANKKPSPKLNSSNSVKLVYISKSILKLFHMKNKNTEERTQIPQDFKKSFKEFLINKMARATPGNEGKTKSIPF